MTRPSVGVGVIIKKDNQVLLGLRRSSHGAGTWAFPGGHLEMWETIEDCARREVEEETGLKIKNVQAVSFTNDHHKNDDVHGVTLFVTADYLAGEAENREPEKCEKWQWFGWDELPEPKFLALENLLEQDYNPFANDYK